MNTKEISRHPIKNTAFALGVIGSLYSGWSYYDYSRQNTELHNKYEASPEGQQVSKLRTGIARLNQAYLYLCPKIAENLGDDAIIFRDKCKPSVADYVKRGAANYLSADGLRENTKELQKLPNINAAIRNIEQTIFDAKDIDPSTAQQLVKSTQKLKDLPANPDDIDSKFQLANTQIVLDISAGKLSSDIFPIYNNPVSESSREMYKKMEESGLSRFSSVLGFTFSIGMMGIGLSNRKKTRA